MSRIVSNARAASLVLEHTFTQGLPQPWTMTVTRFDDRALADVELGFDSPDHVQAWADFMGSEVGAKVHRLGNQVVTKGEVLELAVRCWYFERNHQAVAS